MSVSICAKLPVDMVFAALTGGCLTFGKVLSITPKFFSTLQLMMYRDRDASYDDTIEMVYVRNSHNRLQTKIYILG